jgi:DNA-binding NtrC family response regulator
MVSASTSLRPVVEAIRVGAYDYVTKPFDVAEIRHIVAARPGKQLAAAPGGSAADRGVAGIPGDGIIGDAPAYRRALDDARKAAETDSTILITGESGTGKELVARCVHAWSTRREEPFVAVHCAAIPEPLMESELFGYEKGAFTHAESASPAASTWPAPAPSSSTRSAR